MFLTRCMSWKARINSCTRRVITPCSRSGAWLAGHKARLRTNPIRAKQSGRKRALRQDWIFHLTVNTFDEGPTRWRLKQAYDDREPTTETNGILSHFCFSVAWCHMTKRTNLREEGGLIGLELNWLFFSLITAGSVISSRSPAWIMVRTRASIPPTWHTTVLLRWLLHVRFERMPAAHVITFTSLDPSNWTSPWSNVSSPSCYEKLFTKNRGNVNIGLRLDESLQLTCFVAASDRFRQVHRQFWTKRWLWWPKCIANACIPPASTIAGLLLEHTDKTSENFILDNYLDGLFVQVCTFKNTWSSPQKFFVSVGPEDSDELHRSLGCQDDQLWFLITISKNLKTVSNDSQKFDIVALEEGNHLL